MLTSVHVAQKNVTCCTKNNVVSTKNIYYIELRCAPQLCKSQKICCADKKNYVTHKRKTHLTEFV